MDFVNNEGVRLHYEVVGEQGPWLALVSGGRRGGAEFLSLASFIASRGLRVILSVRRNTGASQVLIAGEWGEGDMWVEHWGRLM